MSSTKPTELRRGRGFQSPNTTNTPDEIFDVWLSELSGAELKVLLYIVRRTFGFKKQADSISLRQICEGIRKRNGDVLDRGTGLSRTAAFQAVQVLEKRGLLRVARQVADDGVNQVNVYHLVFATDVPQDHEAGEVGQKLTHGRSDSDLGVGQKLTPQQTVRQETEEQHVVVVTALAQFGISHGVAVQLAATYPEAHIMAKVDHVHWLQEHRPKAVGVNPAGYLRRAIEADWTAPPKYQTPAQRSTAARQRDADRAADQERRHQLEREQAQSREQTSQQLDALCPPQSIPSSALSTTEAWQQVLTLLESEITAANYAFVKQARLVQCDEQTALVAAPYSYHLDQLSGRYHPLLTHALTTVLGTPIHCEYTTLTWLANGTIRHPTGDGTPRQEADSAEQFTAAS